MSDTLSRSPYHCPRCTSPMLLGNRAGIAMHGCATCGGVWLGVEAARQFSASLPAEAISLAEQHAENAIDSVETAPNIDCPVCGKPMERTHAAAAGLDIDFCGEHGTWYDHHELEKIARGISKTGWGTRAAIAVPVVAASASLASAGSNDSVVDQIETVIDGVDTALDIADSMGDVGDLASGVMDFFSGLFD